jgi:hypothetical protein
MKKTLLFFYCVIITFSLYPQSYKILSSTSEFIHLELNLSSYKLVDSVIDKINYKVIDGEGDFFGNPGDPYLPQYNLSIGIPQGAVPVYELLGSTTEQYNNVNLLPYTGEETFNQDMTLKLNQEVYSKNELFPLTQVILNPPIRIRYSEVLTVSFYPYQYNPVLRKLIHNKKLDVIIRFTNPAGEFYSSDDVQTSELLKSVVLNYEIAKNWIGKTTVNTKSLGNYWYNPSLDYFKVYIKEKGLYKITYEYLVNSGVPVGGGVPSNSIQIYNEGIQVPLEMIDGNDSVFNEGDYFYFAANEAKPSDFATLNLYNVSNVYWLTYQGTEPAERYIEKNGYPVSWTNTLRSSLITFHREEDRLYERLGYATNGNRDYWFWGKAVAQRGVPTQEFTDYFNIFKNIDTDSMRMTLRVKLHGMANYNNCYPDNKADIYLTGQPLGSVKWDGQSEVTFEKVMYVSEDSIKMYAQGNKLEVWTKGDVCPLDSNGEIRINWYEIDYWRNNIADSDFVYLSSPSRSSGINRFWVVNWLSDSIKIISPTTGRKIINSKFEGDIYNSVLFVDTVSDKIEYYCFTDGYSRLPDAIIRDEKSDLRNSANEADYIIISHKKFTSIAQTLKDFRTTNFPDTLINNPRIKIAYIDEIYDEFSYGLLNPYAVKDFLKHTYDNWVKPSPMYVVLIGDMSYDYRKLLPGSRENYIPSIPVHSLYYGQAVSDNDFVLVDGSDPYPDMVISRISIETVEEGNNFLQKLINYPEDNSKLWKQNILLVSSGLDAQDEASFRFNDRSMRLKNNYVDKAGLSPNMIMRYPNTPEYFIYKGEGPQIRSGIDRGATIVSYYGHGGGYQWDLVFLNDDIELLNNYGRLPFISSVTCYTAHFDNQDVFGEQFIKIPGKGCIAFWGSSGLTLWPIGAEINEMFFDEVITKREYITGKAILKTKARIPYYYSNQISLLTLLGEPLLKLAIPEEADFTIKSNNISIFPEAPLVGDTVQVKIDMYNAGILISGDSLNVELIASSNDTSYVVDIKKIPVFGEYQTTYINWTPGSGGLYNLTVNVNNIAPIPEPDYSDNSASASFAVYDLSEPNIISPNDGFSTTSTRVEVILSDIGYYIDRVLLYEIQIDTSNTFERPIYNEGNLQSINSILKWNSPSLSKGVYFWRIRIMDQEQSGMWSKPRSFSVTEYVENDYIDFGNAFKKYKTYNISYDIADSSLILNTELLPPKPINKNFLEDIGFSNSVLDSIGLSCLTTDGTYLYFGQIWFFALNNNPQGKSFIYRVGTGNNGTVKGEFYGKFSEFYDPIKNQIFYHNGSIYIPTGTPYYLKKISTATGDTSSIYIPDGMLSSETSRIEDGPNYLCSDGNYIYNLAFKDTTGNSKYVLRIFDPSDNWNLIESYKVLTGSSYPYFSGFFVADGYLYPTEMLVNNYMRRIRLNDGFFEEEWIVNLDYQGYYAWSYDFINDEIYTSVFRSGYTPKFSKFKGTYTDASGRIESDLIGPASKWSKIGYHIENETLFGSYRVTLCGLNKTTKLLDTLQSNIPSAYLLDSVNTNLYPYLKVVVDFVDSSVGQVEKIKFKNLAVDYSSLPELVLTKNDFLIEPDSLLQGFTTSISYTLRNFGQSAAENAYLEFKLDDEDSLLHSPTFSLPADSSVTTNFIINTTNLPPATGYTIKVSCINSEPEFYNYNNISQKSFFVVRDSINPLFQLTIDGKEIINGDIVSAKPEIVISLKDNGPLPLKKEDFTLVHNNIQVRLDTAAIDFQYSPHPNSEAVIKWNPVLKDGKQTLEILAKDASGNFFDSTSAKFVFYVYNTFDLTKVFNYPNPFTNETHFTFELRGDDKNMEDFYIKVYTVAGRLIKEIRVDPFSLKAGFNKIHWDGRDQDGDEVANGVYFYKIITKNSGVTKTTIQKLAKIK